MLIFIKVMFALLGVLDVGSCTVTSLYNVVDVSSVSYNSKVLVDGTVYSNYDAKILIPASLESGVYELTISNEQGSYYSTDDGDIYIETSYCGEYVYSEDVILKWSGYSGTLFFED